MLLSLPHEVELLEVILGARHDGDLAHVLVLGVGHGVSLGALEKVGDGRVGVHDDCVARQVLPAPPDGKLVAAVARYNLSPRGRFTLVLENGEIWQQMDSDDGAAQFKQRGRNVVQISKGFWGSYDLRLNGANIVFKVTRIK